MMNTRTKRNNWQNSSSRAMNENRAAKYWSWIQQTTVIYWKKEIIVQAKQKSAPSAYQQPWDLLLQPFIIIIITTVINKVYRLTHTKCVQSSKVWRRRRRFRIGTRQRSWTRPITWELIPMTALWASEGGAQLSQHTAQVGQINWLDRYACSPGHRAYCCTELTVSSLAIALTTASTHFTIPQRVEGWVDLVGWLRTVDSHPSKY